MSDAGRRPQGVLSYEMRCQEQWAEQHEEMVLKALWDRLRKEMGPGKHLLHLELRRRCDPQPCFGPHDTLVWAKARWEPEPTILLTDAPQDCFALLVDGPAAGRRMILRKVMPSLPVPLQTQDVLSPPVSNFESPTFRTTTARYELRRCVADVLHYHYSP